MANVLVVDDESAIVQLLKLVLTQYGCTVLSASGGVEALMLFSSYRSTIDLLLTDVAMPGMTGVELVERVRAIDPGVAILLMSGSVPEDTKIPDDLRVLKKPFLPRELIEVVEQILQSVPHRDFGKH